jgi:hypothetical protein
MKGLKENLKIERQAGPRIPKSRKHRYDGVREGATSELRLSRVWAASADVF